MLAPGVCVHTPYGATEALPVSSIDSDRILDETAKATAAGKGVCVGRPVGQVDVAIIPISDGPVERWTDTLCLPPGSIGEIVVSGPVVTKSYCNRPDATRLAKIPDPRGGFWHRMGDIGYLDKEGRLWMCGRKTQRVRTAAGELYTVPCEGIFNAHPAVFRSALVGVGTDRKKQEPVLCVELKKDAPADREGIRDELLCLGARHPSTRALRTVLFHPNFPVDIRHNAKIAREQLAKWAARRMRQ